MCSHRKVVYLGQQRDIKGKIAFNLYNCMNCQSTITSKVKLPPDRLTKNSKAERYILSEIK